MIDSLRARQLRDLAREDLGKYINAQKDITHHWAKVDELRTRAQYKDYNKTRVQLAAAVSNLTRVIERLGGDE